jgi:hypothetical protein
LPALPEDADLESYLDPARTGKPAHGAIRLYRPEYVCCSRCTATAAEEPAGELGACGVHFNSRSRATGAAASTESRKRGSE